MAELHATRHYRSMGDTPVWHSSKTRRNFLINSDLTCASINRSITWARCYAGHVHTHKNKCKQTNSVRFYVFIANGSLPPPGMEHYSGLHRSTAGYERITKQSVNCHTHSSNKTKQGSVLIDIEDSQHMGFYCLHIRQ
jgi:hypothetical protein